MESRQQRVPDLLLDERKTEEGESYEDYKERLKNNAKAISEYLEGYPMDASATPSQRLLKRIWQGKRTISGLSRAERNRLKFFFDIGEEELDTIQWMKDVTEIPNLTDNS